MEDVINCERLLEMTPKIIEFKAIHGLINGTPLPFVELSPGILAQDLEFKDLSRHFKLSTASISQFHSSVIINFINQLTLEFSQSRTLMNQLSKGSQAMDANIAMFLEWICCGYSELHKKSPTSNLRMKLFEVCYI